MEEVALRGRPFPRPGNPPLQVASPPGLAGAGGDPDEVVGLDAVAVPRGHVHHGHQRAVRGFDTEQGRLFLDEVARKDVDMQDPAGDRAFDTDLRTVAIVRSRTKEPNDLLAFLHGIADLDADDLNYAGDRRRHRLQAAAADEHPVPFDGDRNPAEKGPQQRSGEHQPERPERHPAPQAGNRHQPVELLRRPHPLQGLFAENRSFHG